MSKYLLKKIAYALVDAIKLNKKKTSPRLIMNLLVKNEEDMLEQNILFHKLMGVDGFIITDNNLSDRTHEIIQAYKYKGWVLEVINEKETD